MNIETDKKTLDELTGSFRFSDAVIRNLVVSMPAAVTEPSPMARAEEEGGRAEEAACRRARDDSAVRGLIAPRRSSSINTRIQQVTHGTFFPSP